MTFHQTAVFRLAKLLGFLVFCPFILGCMDQPEIRSYTVSKADGRKYRRTIQPVELVEQQILGVIVPHDESAWFFKLMDTPENVTAGEEDFRSVVESVSFDDAGTPKWELPESWQEVETQSMFTYAKITNQNVSITVTRLPANTEVESGWKSCVLQNVNRWRGQVSLAPQEWENMLPTLTEVEKLSTAEAKAFWVDLTGQKSSASSMAPFANRMMTSRSAPPPAEEPEVKPEPVDTGIQYQAPSEWDEQPAGGFRKAFFMINSEDEKQAVVTVSTASGKIEMFFDMWFGQIGIQGTEALRDGVVKEAVKSKVQDLEVKTYVMESPASPDAETSPKTLIVAEIPWKENESLFVKLVGDQAVVEQQRENFQQFLRSLQW